MWQIYVAPLLYDFNFQGSLRGRDELKICLAEEIRPQTKSVAAPGGKKIEEESRKMRLVGREIGLNQVSSFYNNMVGALLLNN